MRHLALKHGIVTKCEGDSSQILGRNISHSTCCCWIAMSTLVKANEYCRANKGVLKIAMMSKPGVRAELGFPCSYLSGHNGNVLRHVGWRDFIGIVQGECLRW